MIYQRTTDKTKLFNTTAAGDLGLFDFSPGSTTLAAPVASSTTPTITLVSATGVTVNAPVLIGTEKLLITDDSASPTFGVTRGFDGTTPTAHSSGDAVTVPGGFVYQLLDIASAPNCELFLHKVTDDVGYVVVKTASPNLFSDGTDQVVLAGSKENNLAHVKIPSVGNTVLLIMSGAGMGTGAGAGQQLLWRVWDLHNLRTGTRVAASLPVQAAGRGRRITGMLRKAIGADAAVAVYKAGILIGTLPVPAATPIDTEVSVAIDTVLFNKREPLVPNVTLSGGAEDPDGVLSVTVEWGAAGQVSIMGSWKGAWDSGTEYALGDTVGRLGSGWISLQDGNVGEPPESSPTFWDVFAAKGDIGLTGEGVPAGGAAGEVLTKLSSTDFDTGWEAPLAIPLTTKGDSLTYDGGLQRVAVGADGEVWTADSAATHGVKWGAQPYDVAFFWLGLPVVGASAVFTATRPVALAANFAGSQGSVAVNPTATATFTVKNGGTTIGTVAISTGGAFTFATTSGTAKTLAAGDRLTVDPPNPQDATLSDPSFTFAGTR